MQEGVKLFCFRFLRENQHQLMLQLGSETDKVHLDLKWL